MPRNNNTLKSAIRSDLRKSIIEIYKENFPTKVISSKEYSKLVFLYKEYRELTSSFETLIDKIFEEMQNWKLGE